MYDVPPKASVNCFIQLCSIRAVSPLGQSFHADAVCVPIGERRNLPPVNVQRAGCKAGCEHVPRAVFRESAPKQKGCIKKALSTQPRPNDGLGKGLIKLADIVSFGGCNYAKARERTQTLPANRSRVEIIG